MRKMTVIGSRKMAVFDDMEPERKVTVYDKGDWQTPAGRISTHTGDIWVPRIDAREPLRIECVHFLRAVARRRDDARRRRGGRARGRGARGACRRSLDRGGETIALGAAAR